jgi:hypothetical protein
MNPRASVLAVLDTVEDRLDLMRHLLVRLAMDDDDRAELLLDLARVTTSADHACRHRNELSGDEAVAVLADVLSLEVRLGTATSLYSVEARA